MAGEYIVRFNDYRCALVLEQDMGQARQAVMAS